MKRLCLILTAVLLLSGCSAGLGHVLDVPSSPSADLSDRPGYYPTENSGTLSQEETLNEEPSERNMAFEATDTPGLYRVITRHGDLEVLGMTYGDGMFFALTKRDSGISITGYNDEGDGIFAGLLDEDMADGVLLGYTAGYACIYSPSLGATLSCRTDRSYVKVIREAAEEVWLYDGGIAMKRGNTVSLYTPNGKDPSVVFTLPEGYSWVQGNQSGAWVEKSGRLYLLSADGKLSGALSALTTVRDEGHLFTWGKSSVVVGPSSTLAFYEEDIESLLACGKEFAVVETKEGVSLYLFQDSRKVILPMESGFRFDGKTKNGFLYSHDGGYFWYADSQMEAYSASITFYAIMGEPLDIAARHIITLVERTKEVSISDIIPSGSVTATPENDSEKRFTAGVILLESSFPSVKTIFLCSEIIDQGERVSYSLQDDKLFLDISRPEDLSSILQSLAESEK